MRHQTAAEKLFFAEQRDRAIKAKKKMAVKRIDGLELMSKLYLLKVEQISETELRISKPGKDTIIFEPFTGKFRVISSKDYQDKNLQFFMALIYS